MSLGSMTTRTMTKVVKEERSTGYYFQVVPDDEADDHLLYVGRISQSHVVRDNVKIKQVGDDDVDQGVALVELPPLIPRATKTLATPQASRVLHRIDEDEEEFMDRRGSNHSTTDYIRRLSFDRASSERGQAL